jgi:HK97 family phage major capsid protein
VFVTLKKAFLGQAIGARIDVEEATAKGLVADGTAEAVSGDPIGAAVEKSVNALAEGITKTVDTALKQFVEGAAKRPANQAPFVTTGPVGQDSQGYSVLKAAAFSLGYLPAEQCKEEIHVHTQLKDLYRSYGFVPHFGEKSFLVPLASEHIPAFEPKGQALQTEIRQKMLAQQGRYDHDEATWISRRTGYGAKALGTISDAAGGVMVGFPSLGEMIELQRNLEVFANAGCQEIALPPNGRIQFPKLTGGATANWIGEAQSVPESTENTGNLDLQAKKLGVFVKLNNELLRFASPSAEGLVRMDMARVAALKADLGMLEGTGGTQIKGVITYSDITSHSASTAGANGDTFTPADVALMEGKLPDAVVAPTAWVIRKNYYSILLNRRADAVSGGDGAGPFLFHPSRQPGTMGSPPPMEMYGTKVVRSAQVSNTRVKGAGNNLTYVLLGYFPDWVVARMAVMEFAVNMWGEASFQADQTQLRGIQHIDAGARHGASFVICDSLLVA